MSNPIPLTNFFVNRPYNCLAVAIIILGLITSFVAYMQWFEHTQQNRRDYLIWDDPKTLDYDKSIAATALLVAGVGNDTAQIELQSRVDLDWGMFLLYTEKNITANETVSWQKLYLDQ